MMRSEFAHLTFLLWATHDCDHLHTSSSRELECSRGNTSGPQNY